MASRRRHRLLAVRHLGRCAPQRGRRGQLPPRRLRGWQSRTPCLAQWRRWAWNDIDTSRAVIFPGFFEREKASYNADTGQLFGEVAYPTSMGDMALEPFAGIAFVKVDIDSFKEHGDVAALRSGGFDEDVSYSTLGLRAATTMHVSNLIVTPKVAAAWQHAFDDVTPGAALAFASTGIGFDITGVPLAENSLLVEAGLDSI
ncbi:MAG TPA: hypothetical protein DIC31_09830 [Rhizobiales bacterium]|nr:hypothetical protein [Hyphomicrobiales bacterium]